MDKATYELFKRIHDSKGMVYLGRKKSLGFSFNIFRTNYAELRKACAFVENPEHGVKLMSEQHSTSGVAAHMEVNRLFHNFLAGAQTLVEHTRNFMREHYASTSAMEAYNQKIAAEFSGDGLSKFVQDLRNYIVHKGLPNNAMSVHASRESAEHASVTVVTTVSMSRSDLLQWQQWSKAGRAYLEAQDDQIKLSTVADAYGAKVLALHQWLEHKLDKHHFEDLKEVDDLQKRYSSAIEQEEKRASDAR